MENYHGSSPTVKRRSGKKKKKLSDKKKALIGRAFTSTKIGENTVRYVERTKGGNRKVRLKYSSHANVLMTDGTIKKVRILNVLSTPANRHYARANILIKGAVINTEVGHAVITNRVGQDGVVNAKLLDEKQAKETKS